MTVFGNFYAVCTAVAFHEILTSLTKRAEITIANCFFSAILSTSEKLARCQCSLILKPIFVVIVFLTN